jgi:hypothetical protein
MPKLSSHSSATMQPPQLMNATGRAQFQCLSHIQPPPSRSRDEGHLLEPPPAHFAPHAATIHTQRLPDARQSPVGTAPRNHKGKVQDSLIILIQIFLI